MRVGGKSKKSKGSPAQAGDGRGNWEGQQKAQPPDKDEKEETSGEFVPRKRSHKIQEGKLKARAPWKRRVKVKEKECKRDL